MKMSQTCKIMAWASNQSPLIGIQVFFDYSFGSPLGWKAIRAVAWHGDGGLG
jgi:hypothetical protein